MSARDAAERCAALELIPTGYFETHGMRRRSKFVAAGVCVFSALGCAIFGDAWQGCVSCETKTSRARACARWLFQQRVLPYREYVCERDRWIRRRGAHGRTEGSRAGGRQLPLLVG